MIMSREKRREFLKHKSFFIFLLSFALCSAAVAQECLKCHKDVTPNIVSDWKLSKHSQNDVDCSVCYGQEHKAPKDFAKAQIPTPATCANCHQEQVDQFKKGKHAAAWAAMKAMPTFHWQPMALTEGMKGCGGCHKIGLKTEEEIKELKRNSPGFGVASCDACHTRHIFSVQEAKQPQACQPAIWDLTIPNGKCTLLPSTVYGIY